MGHYIAIGGEVEHHGLLRQPALEQWRQLRQHLSANWKSSHQARLLSIDGCLGKLSATLLQASRLRQTHEHLIGIARENLGAGAECCALRGAEACADFEALLLQGRATLDRLTWFLSREFKQQCSDYRKLNNILTQFGEKDDRAGRLLEITSAAETWINGLLARVGSDSSFRDFVAHIGSATERMTACFGITFLDETRALISDCELGKFAVFQLASELAQYIPFIVLSTLSVCIDQSTVPLADFGCLWEPRTVVLSAFETTQREGPCALMVVRRMHPDGFDIERKYYNPDVLKLAIDFKGKGQ